MTSTAVEGPVPRSVPSLSLAVRESARRLATIVLVGAACGLLFGGVGGRLAMLVLARLNPEVAGVESDDGFVMGQFTVRDTVNLLLAGLLLGLVGAVIYFVVRALRFGPRWFQVLSIAVGAGVCVAAPIVHPDGVDFQLLKPLWLAIGLFIAIPFLYGGALTLVAERWLADGSWYQRLPGWAAYLPLALLLLVPFVIPVLVVGWVAAFVIRSSAAGGALLQRREPRWFGRLILAGYFTLALQDLVADAAALA